MLVLYEASIYNRNFLLQNYAGPLAFYKNLFPRSCFCCCCLFNFFEVSQVPIHIYIFVDILDIVYLSIYSYIYYTYFFAQVPDKKNYFGGLGMRGESHLI